jgi:hypothetical protein
MLIIDIRDDTRFEPIIVLDTDLMLYTIPENAQVDDRGCEFTE